MKKVGASELSEYGAVAFNKVIQQSFIQNALCMISLTNNQCILLASSHAQVTKMQLIPSRKPPPQARNGPS